MPNDGDGGVTGCALIVTLAELVHEPFVAEIV